MYLGLPLDVIGTRSVAAWSGAAAARVEPAPRRTSRPRPSVRRAPAGERSGIVGGVVWIGAIAALLAGVVALNVAALQLNVRLDRLTSERANLRAENARLAAQLSSAVASAQVEAQAVRRLGLVRATHERTTYVQLPARTP